MKDLIIFICEFILKHIRNAFRYIFKGDVDWIRKLPVDTFVSSRYHWYNILPPSPWPFLIGVNSFPSVVGFVGGMHGIINGWELFFISFFTFLFILGLWNRDIIRESTYNGLHTKQVEKNTITGFQLFLFSETMLFVTFFWAHLYSALYPSVYIGLSWPPVGLSHLILDPFDIPLTNTFILVYSGFTVTVSHLYLRRGNLVLSGLAMLATIILGLAFLYIQKDEFLNSQFDISDGIYGSTFFMLTGFHGGHVIIGVTALIITLWRLIELHFSSYSHTGFKLALIYWHFVDVVWIFVFLIVYVLGSDLTYPNNIFYGSLDSKLGSLVNIDIATFGKMDLTQFYHYLYGEDKFKVVDDWLIIQGRKSSKAIIFTNWSASKMYIEEFIIDDQNTLHKDLSDHLFRKRYSYKKIVRVKMTFQFPHSNKYNFI